MRHLFNHENLFAVALCIIIILVVVVSSDNTAQFIYQGF